MDYPPDLLPLGPPHPQRRPSRDAVDPLTQAPASDARDGTSTDSRTPSRQISRHPSAPLPQQHLSVVVTASPDRSSYHTPDVKYDDEESSWAARKQPVLTKLSPQLKKNKKKERIKAVAAAPRTGRQASSAAKQLINNQYDRKRAFRTRETTQSPQRPSASGTSTSTAPTRLGRPKGWRPGMSYAQMRGNPLPKRPRTNASAGVIKRRGRPPKAPSLPPDEIFRTLKPEWLSFLCEWKDCKADLQNLSTLRQHVNAVHLEEQDYEEEGQKKLPWTCLWGSCGMVAQAPTFQTYEEMEDHVEKKHMVSIGWHLGEGPKNEVLDKRLEKKESGQVSENDVPSYLKDKDGNLVTPSIKDQRLEGHAEFKERRRMLWHLMKAFNEGSDSEDEAEHPEPADEDMMR